MLPRRRCVHLHRSYDERLKQPNVLHDRCLEQKMSKAKRVFPHRRTNYVRTSRKQKRFHSPSGPLYRPAPSRQTDSQMHYGETENVQIFLRFHLVVMFFDAANALDCRLKASLGFTEANRIERLLRRHDFRRRRRFSAGDLSPLAGRIRSEESIEQLKMNKDSL